MSLIRGIVAGQRLCPGLESDRKNRTAPRRRLKDNLPVKLIHDLFGDREAEAGSASLPLVSSSDLHEFPENNAIAVRESLIGFDHLHRQSTHVDRLALVGHFSGFDILHVEYVVDDGDEPPAIVERCPQQAQRWLGRCADRVANEVAHRPEDRGQRRA